MNDSLIKIEKLRRKLQLTQEELAEKLGVSTRTIQNWEAGKVIPKTKHTILLSLTKESNTMSISPKLFHEKDEIMTVKKRLIKYLGYKKIGQKRFALSVGLSSGYVNAIKNSIQPATIEKISIQYPDLNVAWLLTGQGAMINEQSTNSMIDIEGVKNVINYLKKGRLITSDSEFASKIGKHRSYISEIRSGKRTITEQFVISINSAFPSISLDWLLTGRGDMVVEANSLINNNHTGTPIYDIDATCGIEVRDYRDEKIIGWIDIPSINKEAIIIKASGDSMNPIIKDGSMIAIREIKNWDIIVFGQIYLIVTPEYRLLKYIRKSKDSNIVILKSANEEFDDIELPKEQIIKLFLVENVLIIKNLI